MVTDKVTAECKYFLTSDDGKRSISRSVSEITQYIVQYKTNVYN
jgi:hypothetical protein